MPLNLQAFELFKAGGHRPAARPPRRLPARVPALARARPAAVPRSTAAATRRSAPRSTTRSRACWATTTCWSRRRSPACRSTTPTDGNTVGPSEINGEAVDPLIGWCLTYLDQLHRPSGRLDPGRPGRRPAGRHADHRPALRRRRRARRKRRLRAAAALAPDLRSLRRSGRSDGDRAPDRGPGRHHRRRDRRLLASPTTWPGSAGATWCCWSATS